MVDSSMARLLAQLRTHALAAMILMEEAEAGLDRGEVRLADLEAARRALTAVNRTLVELRRAVVARPVLQPQAEQHRPS